jgi:hypothetical protein
VQSRAIQSPRQCRAKSKKDPEHQGTSKGLGSGSREGAKAQRKQKDYQVKAETFFPLFFAPLRETILLAETPKTAFPYSQQLLSWGILAVSFQLSIDN